MAQASYLTEATITLVSISLIYIALFLCGLVVFLLTLIIFQWIGSKQCAVCLKRLRRSDNYCHYCGTATHAVFTPAPPTVYSGPPANIRQQALPSTSTVYSGPPANIRQQALPSTSTVYSGPPANIRQQALPSTSTVYRPPAAWPAASRPPISRPPIVNVPMLAAPRVRYTTDSYNTIDDPDYLCPTCHGPLHLSDTFCGSCGGRLVPTVHQIRS
ncbi:hypothetical protein KDH_18620 [Dictyobacter sp. S3.2.2.5]|uniref:Zinc-ribbon domain-containing protein n=1 Tax=Dictyobacter halimunensis TaxID=3026934 RepID=A0ABQ6FL80_9CHLR|nr:hypothetical protein KDH_18620 [Dictyobacter sp. S3.2.2.5]